MRKKLWGVIPAWALAVALVIALAGTAWAAYRVTTRDIPVTIQEPITIDPDAVSPVTFYPGQSVVFTVTNAADVPYGMQYVYTLDNQDSGVQVKMEVDSDGHGTEADYASFINGRTVTIGPKGTHFLKVICTEESAPGPSLITITFNRKPPAT